MLDVKGELIVKVHTVDGMITAHSYHLPEKEEDRYKIIDNVLATTLDLNRDKLNILLYGNPMILYNAENVIGVEITSADEEQIKERLEKQKRKMGLVRK